MGSIGVSCHTSVAAGRQAVLDRLPAGMTVAGLGLATHAAEAGRGTYGRDAVSVPVRWSRGRRSGGGHLELAPLASDRTLLLLHLEPPAGPLLDEPARALLERLRDRLEGRAEPAPAPSRAPEPAGRRAVAAVTAGLGLGVIALGLLVLASSPTAVSLDDRVADFRAGQATGGTTADAGRARSVGSDGPPVAGTPGGGPAAAAPVEPDEQEPAAVVQAAPAPADQDRAEPLGDEGAGRTPSLAAADGRDDDRDDSARQRPGRPEAGVYRYATSGGERLDVRGSARDYPSTTTITVHHDDCGFRERWDVFDERWEVRSWCLEDGGRGLVGLVSYREFFGYGQRHEMHCDGATPPPGRGAEPGASWEVTCSDDGTTATTRIEVVGPAAVDVAGQRLDTLHLRMETRIEGETSGRMATERWIVPDTGLLVRERQQTEVETAGPVGRMAYTEDYALLLESAEPAR